MEEFEVTQVPDWLIFTKTLTYFERLVLFALISHSCGYKSVSVKQETLAADFGVSQALINQKIKALTKKKYISVEKNRNGNKYFFLFKQSPL